MNDQVFDYVIVGAGTSGCVVAGRLSELGKFSICVLEAGPTDTNPFIHIPAGVLYTLRNPSINWMYKGAQSPELKGRAINHPRGKTLGGSGSINGHIYNRGQKEDFDHWAQLGNQGWSYEDVLPYFIKSERKIGGGDKGYRGEEGPFTITEVDETDALSDAFIEAAVNTGIPRNPDYNGRSQLGIAYAQRSIYQGRRVSPARCFLSPAQKRGNTRVITNAQAVKICFEGNQACAVQYKNERSGSNTRTVLARREIVVCSGAIGSPHLLEVSGIGDAPRLASLGIQPVQHLPGVGENFRDHYAVRSIVRIQGQRTINDRVRGLSLVRELIRYGVHRKGALALAPTLVYCFWKSNPALDHGDIQLTFTPASYPGGVQSGLDKFPGATVACWQQRPESTGYVHAVGSDGALPPEIQGNYLTAEIDRQVLLQAIRLSRKILQTDPFRKFVEVEIWPGPALLKDEELLAHARETGNTAYHPMGTCRMGPTQRSDSVVDAKLRVHGVQKLRVADASIMPTILSANLNAGSLMIGEKAAAMIIAAADE